MLPRELVIDTPEGLHLRLTLAGIGERVCALLIDLALLFALHAGAWLFARAYSLSQLTMLLGGFLLRYGYFLGFELGWQGATPGKRLLGLKVVSRDGGSLDARAILVRNLMRDAELFFPAYALLGTTELIGEGPGWLASLAFAWLALLSALPLFNQSRARAGDLLAGTVVVRVPKVAFLVDEAALGEQRAREHDLRPQHLGVYGNTELETLAELLREVDPLGPREVELFARVADTIATRVGYPRARASQDPEGFLRAFYGAQRAFLERQLLCGRRKLDKQQTFEPV